MQLCLHSLNEDSLAIEAAPLLIIPMLMDRLLDSPPFPPYLIFNLTRLTVVQPAAQYPR